MPESVNVTPSDVIRLEFTVRFFLMKRVTNCDRDLERHGHYSVVLWYMYEMDSPELNPY